MSHAVLSAFQHGQLENEVRASRALDDCTQCESPKERPILMSAPMVRAVLDGSKTMTRRVIVPQPPSVEAVHAKAGIGYSFELLVPQGDEHVFSVCGPVWAFNECAPCRANIVCPYGKPGDRLWVRETWAYHPDADEGIIYRATDPGWDDNDSGMRWTPSIFMPRKASRILLLVNGISVERVNRICESDAIAEGFDGRYSNEEADGYKAKGARERFQELWNTLNAKRGFGWDVNPWVWVVSFTRVLPEGLPDANR
jgi:hypothetical protein